MRNNQGPSTERSREGMGASNVDFGAHESESRRNENGSNLSIAVEVVLSIPIHGSGHQAPAARAIAQSSRLLDASILEFATAGNQDARQLLLLKPEEGLSIDPLT